MESDRSWVKNILLTAGIIEIVLGLAHFVFPYFAYQSKGYSLLNYNEIDFVTLCIFCVGILLVAFGTCTVFLSSKVETAIKIVFFYTIVKSILWTGRVILGILYPANIPLFFIEQPNIVVFPTLVFEWLLFVFSFFVIKTRLKAVSGNDSLTDEKNCAAY
jgi:hypothetical protein